MPTPVKKIQSDDEILNRIQDGIIPVINAVLAHPILDGRIVDTLAKDVNGQFPAIVLGAAAVNVPHLLGRKYQGWEPIDRNANAAIWVDPPVAGVDPNPDPTKFVRLVASATVTVKLWVF